jgi:hypothetical protein
MERRRFLEAVAAGLPVCVAGCIGDPDGGVLTGSDDSDGTVPSDRDSVVTDPDLPLSESDLIRAAPKDDIPAITDPAFDADWSAVTATLGDRDRVIGVEADGDARAYPLPVLNWHEVVNDDFGGPLLVTYCPLCQSGVTAERRVDGEETTFGVSGYLWQRDLVLYDDLTDSLWSQILGRAVRGSRTGDSLSLRPSTMTTWGEWRREYPDSSVLLPPPESGTVRPRSTRNYNTNPYGEYEDIRHPRPGASESEKRLPPKSLVVGVATEEVAKAYPLRTVVEAEGVVNDRVGELPVVVASTDESLVAYDRRVDGETLTFDRDGAALTAGGSRWGLVSGRALDGPHAGRRLSRATDRSPMFWFAWLDFFPGSRVYGQPQ